MQLILLIALLLASGNGGDEFYKEVKPLLECVGGEDIKQAFKSAEEFKGVLAAIGSMSFGSQNGAPQNDMCDKSPPNRQTEKKHTYTSTNQPPDKNTSEYASFNRPADTYDKNCPPADGDCSEEENAATPFAMAPVARIADREIIYRLVQYFSEGAENA